MIVDGKQYKTMSAGGITSSVCSYCAFKGANWIACNKPKGVECSPVLRDDGRDVYFVELKETKK